MGLRTNQPDGAHIEYFRGIANPIAMKVGPGTTPEKLLELIGILDPDQTPGRLTLITRFGADKIGDHLPPLIRAVEDSGHPVVWACDPMHGNTFTSGGGRKTRRFNDILSELQTFFQLLWIVDQMGYIDDIRPADAIDPECPLFCLCDLCGK